MSVASIQPNKVFRKAEDFFPIIGTDFIELYVGNAKQAAHFYKSAMGFQSLAYSGLETSNNEFESFVVQQGAIRLVLTSPLKSNTEIGRHIEKHGDGVRKIALQVEDAEEAFNIAIEKGAKSFLKPIALEDEFGKVIQSGIHAYGDVVHIFVQRDHYEGCFLPGYKNWKSNFNPASIGLKYVVQ